VNRLPALPVEPAALADVQAAITLIEKGKAGMALAVLRGLPERLHLDVIEAAGWALMRGELAKAERKAKRPLNRWLGELVADPATRVRAKALLCLDDAGLDDVVSGERALATWQRRRLKRGLLAEPPKGRHVPKVRLAPMRR
jgi:hypothetical protein